MVFIGVDPSGGKSPFTYAILDEQKKLIQLGKGEIEDVVELLKSNSETFVGINAPSGTSQGLKKNIQGDSESSIYHTGRLEMRVAEYKLRQMGINVSPTPSKKSTCPGWIQLGFDLYDRINSLGYQAYPAENSTLQWIETHSHAAFQTLIGKQPLPKPTLEGRLQRQLVLYENGIGIKDPMDFFEEITRHKLINGVLPTEYLFLPEELDAIVAAFLASLISEEGQIEMMGDRSEGQIALPRANKSS